MWRKVSLMLRNPVKSKNNPVIKKELCWMMKSFDYRHTNIWFIYQFLFVSVVIVNLLDPSFVPGKNYYERVKWSFTNRLSLCYNMLVSWIPHSKFFLNFVEYICYNIENEMKKTIWNRNVLSMSLNCIWWRGSCSEALGSLEYPFIACAK